MQAECITNNFFVQQGISKIALLNISSALSTEVNLQALKQKLQQLFDVECTLVKQDFCSDPLTQNLVHERANVMLECLRDASIDAIWFVRGGEGAADVIFELDKYKSEIASLKPKYLYGYSDLTALHLYFSQQYNWPCIHAPLAFDIFSDRINLNDYLDLNNLQSINDKNTTLDFSTVRFTGGNLTMLALGVAEVWQMQSKDKVVLLEDVNEAVHAIMRNLKHLSRIGLFAGARALVFGQLLDPASADLPRLSAALELWASGLEIPVFMGAKFGHGAVNMPWRYG